jgi:hypothetical protein
MAAGATTPGRRRERGTKPWDLEPGDYMLNVSGVAWVRLPNGVGPSLLEGWSVEVHDDATITLRPSILDRSSGGGGWHGYLERGTWRTV